MAYTTVPKSTDYFKPEIYTGNGSSKTISTLNFQSDFTWIKNRGTTDRHSLFDAVRAAPNMLTSNANNAQLNQLKTIVRETPKLGRNETCWCDSGKKYKHCHGK